MGEAYVVDILRTPVGKFGGSLASVRPDDLAALVIRQIMDRNPFVKDEEIEDVIFGAANQAGEDNRNVARMAGLMAGLPISTGGVTVNRLCASGLQSIMDASRALMLDEGSVYIAGGVESMTRAPFVMAKAGSAFSRQTEIYDTSIGWRFVNPRLASLYPPYSMGETAENVAQKYGISREDQDEFAHGSQLKYDQAHREGIFKEELIPVAVPRHKQDDLIFDKDEHPRLTSLEKLHSLSPAFREGGTVTAGNSSGINDGAACCLLVSGSVVRRHALSPLARVVSYAIAGVNPDCMGMGPVPATEKALQRAGLDLEDIELVELNEAFAAQSVACIREMDLDPDLVNVNGGSIAIGHPLGASGTRISATLLYEMQRRNVRYGLATMCVGVGQGAAVIFESM